MIRLPLALFFLAGALATAAPVEQSISTSRQFVVYGTDLAVRGAICDFAERTKRELLNVLNEPDEWTTAIVINAQYPQANLPGLPRVSVDLGQTGFGLKLQLDLVVDAEIGQPQMRRELLRALVLDMAYRRRPNIPAGSAYVTPPDWLLDGVPAVRSDLSRDRVTTLLAVPTTAKSVLPLQKFLGQRPELLDDAGRTLYRAYSFALVDFLRQSPDGPRRLARFIADLADSSNDPMTDLRKHFPGLFEPDVAEQTWQKQIARLSIPQPYQLLSTAETEQLLSDKLRVKISEHGVDKDYELREFPVFLRRSSARNILASLAGDLRSLAARANPVFTPIVSEYAELVTRMVRGKTAGLTKRLENLQAARRAVAAQMHEIDDYLNWFEATNPVTPSGQFAGYMKAAEQASQPAQTKHDPISIYLDVLETQFEN